MRKRGHLRQLMVIPAVPCRGLVVYAPGARNTLGHPLHFSHLVRDWLPVFLACTSGTLLSSCSSSLIVPDDTAALYARVVPVLEPQVAIMHGAELDDKLALVVGDDLHQEEQRSMAGGVVLRFSADTGVCMSAADTAGNETAMRHLHRLLRNDPRLQQSTCDAGSDVVFVSRGIDSAAAAAEQNGIRHQ